MSLCFAAKWFTLTDTRFRQGFSAAVIRDCIIITAEERRSDWQRGKCKCRGERGRVGGGKVSSTVGIYKIQILGLAETNL